MSFRFCPVCAEPLEPIAGGNDVGLPGCPTGHFVHYDNPAATVFAFIERDGEYLALCRAEEPDLGGWDLPGGFIEAGETPIACVRREIVEETGLEVEIVGMIGAYAGRYGPGGKWTVDIGYLCRVTGGTFSLSAEKSQACWLPLDAFPWPAFTGEQEALGELRRRAAAPHLALGDGAKGPDRWLQPASLEHDGDRSQDDLDVVPE